MEGKETYILYVNYHEQIHLLSNEQAGILFKTIDLYVNDLNPSDPSDPLINIVWKRIKKDLKTDLKRWKEQCSKNRDNVLKRWNKSNTNENENKPTNTSVYERIPKIQANTNYTDTEHEHEHDMEHEHDNISDLTEHDNLITKDFAQAHEEDQKNFENDFWEIIKMLEQCLYITEEESLDRKNIEAYTQCIKQLLQKYSKKDIVMLLRRFGRNYDNNYAIDTDDNPIQNKPAYLYTSIVELAKAFKCKAKNTNNQA